MKHCNSCNKTKDKSEFGNRAASPDGLAAKCKSCQKEYDSARLRSPKRMAARRDYQKTDKGKAAHKKACEQWLSKNPVKRAAHLIVASSVKKGLIKPMPCEVCECAKSNAHHDDYLKPLDVRWLCDLHHSEWHSKNGEAKNSH